MPKWNRFRSFDSLYFSLYFWRIKETQSRKETRKKMPKTIHKKIINYQNDERNPLLRTIQIKEEHKKCLRKKKEKSEIEIKKYTWNEIRETDENVQFALRSVSIPFQSSPVVPTTSFDGVLLLFSICAGWIFFPSTQIRVKRSGWTLAWQIRLFCSRTCPVTCEQVKISLGKQTTKNKARYFYTCSSHFHGIMLLLYDTLPFRPV